MSNITVYPHQSNTKPGYKSYPADTDLAGKEGCLALLTKTGIDLPSKYSDLAMVVVLGEQTSGSWAAQSLILDGNIRVRASGTGSKGDILILADPAGADVGKVQAIPDLAQAGQYFSPGIAEEDFVDGQLVLVRPMPRMIYVPSVRLVEDNLAALRGEINDLLETYGFVVEDE